MKTNQNVLMVGDGGRGHAIGKKMSESPHVGTVYFAPGNAGTASCGQNIDIKASDFVRLQILCEQLQPGLVVVGPEEPLIDGIVDYLDGSGVPVFGPSKQAAQLEIKAYAKPFMRDFGIPTARFELFSDFLLALAHVRSRRLPFFVKAAAGSAAGKGAIPCRTLREAEIALWNIMRRETEAFGAAGQQVVIEDFLVGCEASIPEVSMHVLSDDNTLKVLSFVQDYKQLGLNPFGLDETLNTGSMGSIGPIILSPADYSACVKIAERIFAGLKSRGIVYKGCMKIDFMLTEDGPKVLEINVRFGDSEAQVLMRLLKSDLFLLLHACTTGTLADVELEWHRNLYAASVNLVSGGYPEKYETGYTITGFEKARQIQGVEIYHAGTALRGDEVVSDGGRVLNMTATDGTLQEAVSRACSAAKCMSFTNMHYRDIGRGLLAPA